MTVEGCFSCSENGLIEPAPRQSIWRDDHWRLAHAFNAALPGWLVAVSTQHALSIDELPTDAGASLGTLIHRASRALRSVTACMKVYVMFFAEGQGFEHVHVHLVPRMAGFTRTERGPNVFTFLTRPEGEWVAADEMDRIAMAVRDTLGSA